MFQHKQIFFVLIFILAGIAGCAAPIAPPPSTQWQAQRASLLAITHFTAKGKVAFFSPKERVSAHFIWEQKGKDISLRVTNFLGSTLFKLETTPEKAILIDNQGKTHTGSDASNLLKALTGIALPVDDMTQWIKGLPSTKNTYSLSKGNRLASLSQRNPSSIQPGWQVNYTAYDAKSKNLLPSKITMQLDRQKVNLVISQWTYNR